jgi:hypothetical protein
LDILEMIKETFVRVILVILFLVLLLLPGSSFVAQSPYASIVGIVLDPDSKAIPGAEIIVVNDVTRVQYETKTNNDGIYTVPNLPPGPYRVQVSKVGGSLPGTETCSPIFRVPISALA